MLLAAAILTALLGLVHSVIGEILVFRGLTRRLAASEKPVLPAQQVRVLRASWHLVTIFGLALAAALLGVANPAYALPPARLVGMICIIAALYWLPATRGRHPAWIVLLAIASLCLAAGVQGGTG